jgi:hypothetical protein
MDPLASSSAVASLPVLLASLLLAFGLGAAIQRGGACSFAAVAQIVRQRRAHRFEALMEASLFVFAALVASRATGAELMLPPARDFVATTFLGAGLLGLGAYVNRACPLGALVHIGRGEIDYLATPLGFFLGCLAFRGVMGTSSPASTLCESFRDWPAFTSALALLYILGRAAFAFRREQRRAGTQEALAAALSPRAVTIASGAMSAGLLLLAGNWSYTDFLVDLSAGMGPGSAGRAGFAFALVSGAVFSGRLWGQFRLTPPRLGDTVRRLAGGLLMGAGALTIPGGHDALIFIHIPLGRPFAVAAFATMCGVMAAAVALEELRSGARR